MPRSASCPVGIADICTFGLKLTADTDTGLFGVVATHVMNCHGAGPGEAFEAAGQVLPHVWADYVRDARDHPDKYR